MPEVSGNYFGNVYEHFFYFQTEAIKNNVNENGKNRKLELINFNYFNQ